MVRFRGGASDSAQDELARSMDDAKESANKANLKSKNDAREEPDRGLIGKVKGVLGALKRKLTGEP